MSGGLGVDVLEEMSQHKDIVGGGVNALIMQSTYARKVKENHKSSKKMNGCSTYRGINLLFLLIKNWVVELGMLSVCLVILRC